MATTLQAGGPKEQDPDKPKISSQGPDTHEFGLPPEVTGGNTYDTPGNLPQGGRVSSFSNSTGGGNASFSRGDELDPVRQAEQNGGFNYNPSGDTTAGRGDSSQADSPSDIQQKEKNPNSSDEEGGGFSRNNFTSSAIPVGGRGVFTRRRTWIAVGSVTGLAAAGAVTFFTLIPLKIETLVKDIENKALQTTQNAIQKENQTLFEKYVVSKVMPGYKTCGGTGTVISRHCSTIPIYGNGSNPVTNLYKAWSQSHFEEKLATDYGIEFRYHPASGTWYIRGPDLKGDVSLGSTSSDISTNLDSVFSTRTAARAAVSDVLDNALEGESHWKEAYLRYKIGRLLEEKYGLPRCVVVCRVTDPLHDFVASQQKAAALYLTQRVVIPRTQALGIALECLLTGCDPTQTQVNGDPASPAEAGTPEDQQVEKPVSDGIKALAAKYEITDEASIEAIQKIYSDIGEQGLQKWLITAGLQQLGATQASAEITADAVPIAGEINLAAQIIHDADGSNTALKKLRYVINSSEDINTLETYKVFADELHNGNASATEVGSMIDSLGATKTIGQTAKVSYSSAESSPIYQDVIDGRTGVSNSTGSASSFKCNDGKTVPAGQLVCPEEQLGGGSSIANTIHEFLSTTPGISEITTLANAWTSTIGQFFNLVQGLFGDIIGPVFSGISDAASVGCGLPLQPSFIPGFCQMKDLATKATGIITTAVTSYLIPSQGPFDGGHILARMVGGGVAEERDAGVQIGGHTLTTAQVASIDGEQEAQAKQQFAQEPFFARMFSTDSQYSLVSQLAMAMPSDFQSSIQSGFASLISDPFSSLSHSFGSLFSTKTSADTGASDADMFTAMDAPAIGLTNSDVASISNQDQEAYWTQNCNSDESQGFQNGNTYNLAASQKTDPQTGMPEYDTANYCKLMQTSACSMGVTMDTNTCAPDDVADVNNGNNQSAPTNPTPAPPSSYFTVAGRTVSDPNGPFVPYGISVVDDLEQPDWQNSNNQAASDAQIQAAAAYWHVNTIRLQVSEANIMANPDPSKGYNVAAMQRLQSEVDEIENLHKIPVINDNTEFTDGSQVAPTSRTVAFWKAVTDYLSGIDKTKYDNVILDIYNEPRTIPWNVWQAGGNFQGTNYVGMQDLVNSVRANGNSLSANLIWVEGPQFADSLSQLDTYPVKGTNLVFAFHHLNINDPSSWNSDAGLSLKTPVALVDGEWAQYASTRPECYDQAPTNAPQYLSFLKNNNIGLIAWSLEPGRLVQTNNPQPPVDIVQSWFPTTAVGYSQPNSFNSNYACSDANGVLGQGVGSLIMDYFKNSSN